MPFILTFHMFNRDIDMHICISMYLFIYMCIVIYTYKVYKEYLESDAKIIKVANLCLNKRKQLM